nr:neuronal acetylcholine receptor subunit alpha-7-like isoform X1 [Lytechinus pictus]
MVVCRNVILTLLILSLAAHISANQSSDNSDGIKATKTKLYNKLIGTNYGPTTSRPVKNESYPVTVRMRMLVDHVVEFDEPRQQVTLFCSMKLVWRDEYLTWNESEYGDLDHLDIDVDKIWQPSATLLTSNDDQHLTMLQRLAFVDSSGEVTWLSPVIITTSCRLNVELFPFDEQLCTVEFGPWARDRTQEDMEFFFDENEKSAQRYRQNGVWAIVNDTAARILRNYSGFAEPIAEIHYFFWFKRQSKVYVLSIVIPSALLSLSTMLIFLLPPESGEKISFGITNLLAMVLFQETVRSAMPPTGSPIFANYICVTVVVACMSLIFEAIVLRMYNLGDTKKVPAWLYRRCCAAMEKNTIPMDTLSSSRENGNVSPSTRERHPTHNDGLMGCPDVKQDSEIECVSGHMRTGMGHHSSLNIERIPESSFRNAERWKVVAAWFEKNVAILLLVVVFGNMLATSLIIAIKKSNE